MSKEECKREHTHRQMLDWIYWLDQQWNKPDRGDHYNMRIALEIAAFRHMLSQSKSDFDKELNDFKIPFGIRRGEPEGAVELTVEELTAIEKAKFGIVIPKQMRQENVNRD